jgi:hypothetical protein
VKERIIDLANAIRIERYGDAVAVFAAGSIIRGEGTPFSDLDLVVVYGRLPHAYRESLRAKGCPVEAFVHDPETLEYFYTEVDRPTGVPALAQMVVEGIEIPGSTELSQKLKRRAAAVIEAGPPALDRDGERRMRYSISDLLDDLRTPRSRAELIAAGTRMFGQLADYYLRRRGRWSATGKAIPRVLQRTDAVLCTSYCDAFEELFARGNPQAVIRLTEDLLNESGGPLFDGYRADAPPAWRRDPGSPPDPR